MYGLFRPFKGLNRRHFALGTVVSLVLVGATAPESDQSKTQANAARPLSTVEMQALERKNGPEIARLRKQLRVAPVSDTEGNRDAYKRLVELAPANAEFKEKLGEYEERLAARARYEENPSEALSLGKVNWTKDGFGSVMIVNSATVTNDAIFDIKDFTLKCVHYAPSGTEIDSNTRTIFEVVPANGTRTIRNFNMGFIASQAESTSCEISNAKRV